MHGEILTPELVTVRALCELMRHQPCDFSEIVQELRYVADYLENVEAAKPGADVLETLTEFEVTLQERTEFVYVLRHNRLFDSYTMSCMSKSEFVQFYCLDMSYDGWVARGGEIDDLDATAELMIDVIEQKRHDGEMSDNCADTLIDFVREEPEEGAEITCDNNPD